MCRPFSEASCFSILLVTQYIFMIRCDGHLVVVWAIDLLPNKRSDKVLLPNNSSIITLR